MDECMVEWLDGTLATTINSIPGDISFHLLGRETATDGGGGMRKDTFVKVSTTPAPFTAGGIHILEIILPKHTTVTHHNNRRQSYSLFQ